MMKSHTNQNLLLNSHVINQGRHLDQLQHVLRLGKFLLFCNEFFQRIEVYSLFSVKGVIEDYNEYKKFGHDQRKSVAASDDDSDLSDLLSDDDEIFQQYRKSKMNQMNTISKPINDDAKSVRFKITLEELTLDNYVSISDSDGHGRFSIVFLLNRNFVFSNCLHVRFK